MTEQANTNSPLSITLPDGQKIKSTHVCNITIPRLPTIITGHIMPNMTTASIFGIRVLFKVGCKVLLNNNKCYVIYDGKVILTCYKDLTSNLWMLPTLPVMMPQTTLDAPHQSPLDLCMSDAPLRHTAILLYHQTTKENNVKFMHQSLCNPPSHHYLQLSAKDSSMVLHISPRKPSLNTSHQVLLHQKVT